MKFVILMKAGKNTETGFRTSECEPARAMHSATRPRCPSLLPSKMEFCHYNVALPSSLFS